VRPFLSITEEQWHEVLETNLSGAFHLSQAVLPAMVERGYGRVLWFSGMGSFTGAPRHADSLAAKMGLLGMTRSLAKEFAEAGITVNVIVPGVIDTERGGSRSTGRSSADEHVPVLAMPPVGRFGTQAEIAELCAFLASDLAGFVTGQALHVNGGAYLGG
jgi:NAD(P)-dependent dehydrogenase (short-subunit alcohol dehydrogenase family)